MHPEAMNAIKGALVSWNPPVPLKVLEFGSHDVNGTPRSLFNPDDKYIGVDLIGGPGVDIIADAADVTVPGGGTFDVVICAEVFEHAPRWRDIVRNAWEHLHPFGLAIFTAACPPRLPHSAIDGHNMEPQEYTSMSDVVAYGHNLEYYCNIEPEDLRSAMEGTGFREILLKTHPRGDVYAKAVK